MRVLVRLDLGLGDSSGSSEANGVTKLLRIEDSGSSVDFAAFLRKIAVKLGVNVGVEPTPDEWKLYLEGDGGKKALVEDTSEIDEGDTLVLLRRRPAATKRVKREEEDTDGDGDGDEDDELSVETVPYEPPKEVEVIEISDDTEDSDDSSDDSDDESSSSEEDGEDDDDNEYESDSDEIPNEESEGVKKSSKLTEPPLQVHMNDEDVPLAPGKRQKGTKGEDFSEAPTLTTSGARRNLNIDQDIKNRIVKLLNTGFHDGSNEHEAKNAMRLAQRLMRKHNLSQALMLKEREHLSRNDEDCGDEVLKGGLVTVRIVYRKTQKPSLFSRWIQRLTRPVRKNFDVKCYFTTRRGKKCFVTFYGIYTNCQLAAYSFRVAVERISQMTAEYKPARNSVSTKSSRLSYALGIVKGLGDDVNANIKREKEQRERKLERARSAASKGEPYEESDDDEGDDGVGTGYSFPSSPPTNDGPATVSSVAAQPNKRNENDSGVPSESAGNPDAKLSGDKLARRLEEMEQEEENALVLVDHREKVADEVLKERGIKLGKRRKRKRISFDRSSYVRGVIDSKDIDINQRAIRDDWTKKVKKEEK